MDIRIVELLEGAKSACGLAVVIDVFRAFTCASLLLERGAAGIVPVGSLEQARALRQALPGALLVGERGGRIVPGFDGGNSPAQALELDVRGRLVVQTTSGGTQCLAQASSASELMLGSLTTADALVRCLQARRPARVTLVASGTRAEISAPEDLICADYVKAALLGRPRDRGEVLEALRRVPGAARFFDPANASWAPEQDFWLCAGIGRCPFVMRAEERLPSGEFVFRAVPVTA